MATVQNITRPAMIEVLKDSTRGLTHMNEKQMLEIVKQKGLLEQARNLSEKRKQKNELKSNLLTFSQEKKQFSILSAKLREKLEYEVCF